jgi:hypothetical protein
MLRHARLDSHGCYSFTASEGCTIEKEMQSIRHFNIKSLLTAKKTIALIVSEQYSTLTTSIQKLLPFDADWLQQRLHRLWLKKSSKIHSLPSSNGARIAIAVIYL